MPILPFHRRRILVLLGVMLVTVFGACSGSRSTLAPSSNEAMQRPPDYAYPDDDTVRVATWNVEHFVDPYDDPYIDHGLEDDPTERKEGRVALFVEAIRHLDADIVVLQEFERASYLQVLADSLFPELGYRFFAGIQSLDWYQNVVVMSRLPLGIMRSYASVWTPIEGQTDKQGRPAAQALTNHRIWMVDVLARPGYTFSLVGAHLKAGRGERNEGWRRGQIRFLHAEVDRLLASQPTANVLVAGDLNATPESPEFALLLNTTETISAMPFVDPLARTESLTHPSDAPERQLDHLLPSATMMPELVAGSVMVAQPLSGEAQAQASDHLPVVATFLARER